MTVEQGSLADILGEPFGIFSKFVRVFDLYFVATKESADEKLLHGAQILYQYLDNNNDGVPDNELVYAQLLSRQATMVMFKDERQFKKNGDKFLMKNERGKNVLVQDLQADETNPLNEFDASLEECFHLVTVGYAMAYPDVFGLSRGSLAANCCDEARGGYFKKVPKKYPDHAWFTYYDKSCRHSCQVCEYLYWAMTSILGAQENRHEVVREWRLISKRLVEERDPNIFALLTDEKYALPKRLPVSNMTRGVPDS